VLLDIYMPEMGGFEVLRELRGDATLSATRVVAVTSGSYAEDTLMPQSEHITFFQPGGFSSGAVADLMAVALPQLKPDYVSAGASEVKISKSLA